MNSLKTSVSLRKSGSSGFLAPTLALPTSVGRKVKARRDRFCQHILPHRFVKIRRYGIYSSRARAIRKKQSPKMEVPLKPTESAQERLKRLTGFDVYLCPFCKQGTMHRIEELPRVRSPSGFYALNTAWQL